MAMPELGDQEAAFFYSLRGKKVYQVGGWRLNGEGICTCGAQSVAAVDTVETIQCR